MSFTTTMTILKKSSKFIKLEAASINIYQQRFLLILMVKTYGIMLLKRNSNKQIPITDHSYHNNYITVYLL